MKRSLQAAALWGEASLGTASRASGQHLQCTAESSCAPWGSGCASGDNEVTSPERRPCSRGPLAASLLTRSLPVTAVVPRLSEGICHKTWWAGWRAAGSWPDAARIGLPPRFLSHFAALLFPFCSLDLELLIFFFFFPSAALLWFLADKASFSPDLKSRVFQAPGGIHAATDRAGRRTAATFTDCGQGQQGRQLLGHGAPWRKQTLTALWREGGLSSK